MYNTAVTSDRKQLHINMSHHINVYSEFDDFYRELNPNGFSYFYLYAINSLTNNFKYSFAIPSSMTASNGIHLSFIAELVHARIAHITASMYDASQLPYAFEFD